MQYIIFDLEATCWEGNQIARDQEIIEIGAIRLDAFAKRIDTFQKFVRPIQHPSLSPYCRKLTGIGQEDVDGAREFKTVCVQFLDWIEDYEEDYRLCSWGDKDHVLLVNDCLRARLDTDWLRPYSDLKALYHSHKSLQRKIGLKKCLMREGIEFEGNHHRALDDAQNLVELFVRYFDVWAF